VNKYVIGLSFAVYYSIIITFILLSGVISAIIGTEHKDSSGVQVRVGSEAVPSGVTRSVNVQCPLSSDAFPTHTHVIPVSVVQRHVRGNHVAVHEQLRKPSSHAAITYKR